MDRGIGTKTTGAGPRTLASALSSPFTHKRVEKLPAKKCGTATKTPRRKSNYVSKGRLIFPLKLYDMLVECEKDDSLRNIVSWSTNDRGCVIHDIKKFEDRVHPRFFNTHNRLRSFHRQLNIWGFTRALDRSDNLTEYTHPCFVKGDRDLVAERVKRNETKGHSQKKEGIVLHTHNFSSMEDATKTMEDVRKIVAAKGPSRAPPKLPPSVGAVAPYSALPINIVIPERHPNPSTGRSNKTSSILASALDDLERYDNEREEEELSYSRSISPTAVTSDELFGESTIMPCRNHGNNGNIRASIVSFNGNDTGVSIDNGATREAEPEMMETALESWPSLTLQYSESNSQILQPAQDKDVFRGVSLGGFSALTELSRNSTLGTFTDELRANNPNSDLACGVFDDAEDERNDGPTEPLNANFWSQMVDSVEI